MVMLLSKFVNIVIKNGNKFIKIATVYKFNDTAISGLYILIYKGICYDHKT